jgi:Helicase conserved C-terminal domain
LLDHDTEHGHKADELLTLLDEWLLDAAAKVVVFSQWLGTHEVIRRRLALRPWGHVLFHGSVPGEQRGALVERFLSDANCRIFLSIDAGGVGLNLQHAAALVVNMDLPWNPAGLEQRIGRVHRLGQTRGVQVVNLIGQGSIEEGMLGVLAFKKSPFAGVLDGGASEVFLHGTRLASFMKSVEQVAGAMGVQEVDSVASGAAQTRAHAEAPRPELDAPQGDDAAADGSADDPWAGLLQAGAAMLSQLAAQRRPGGGTGIRIEADPETGRPSLRLPMPEPALLQHRAKALAPWLKP